MRLVLLVPCLLGCTLAVTRPAQAQGSARDDAKLIAASPHVYRDRLCVKLIEGSGAELRAGALHSRTGMDLSAAAELFARGRAEPLFTALSWDELDRWHANACAVLPEGRRPGHLGLWFRITAPSVAAADALSDALLDCPLVAYVHKEPIPSPACAPRAPTQDIPPPTPLFTSLQLTHGPSPQGHSIWRAQGVLGARGRGVRLSMIEDDWNIPHEDLAKLVPAAFIGPVPSGASAEANHGLAGASIVIADRNGYGLTGVADEVDIRFYASGLNGGAANTMLMTAANSQPGDVVMMVLMFLLGQLGTDDWVPLELLQAVFDATLTVTANGRIVVVTGANGGRSLDDPRFLRKFDRGFRDSGAIMISASQGGPIARATFANFGSRIDGNSWGDNVVAAGVGSLFYPNNDMRQAYTATYAGTSPAVPTVTGIVAGVQGAARQQLDRALTTAEMLQVLHTIGPASPDAIGRRPDMFAILQSLGIVDGLDLDRPDVPLGGSATVNLLGAPGGAAFLFVAFTTGSLDLGLDRKVHLGLSTMQTIGFLPMPAGTANWTMQVPNDASLSGVSLYFQAGLLQGSSPIHVTNSGQLTIL
jgi:hypothetical protein